MKFLAAALIATLVLGFAGNLRGADDAVALIAALASQDEAERTRAIDGLQKMGETAVEPLRKVELDEKLEPRQLILVRRILGDRLIVAHSLPVFDTTKFTQFGEIADKGIKGNPDLLYNKETKQIVIYGQFVLEQGPLEYVVCIKHQLAKLHETITGVFPSARDISFSMLACGYPYIGELTEDNEFNLPKDDAGNIKLEPGAGIMISVEFEWEPVNAKMAPPNPDGTAFVSGAPKKVVRVPVEIFSWNAQTEKIMKRAPFVFTGSKYERNERGGMDFMADTTKSIVALRLDRYALMNTLLDTMEIDPQRAAGYSINRYSIPTRGTKCRVVFEPFGGGELKKAELTDTVKGKEKSGIAPPPRKAE